MLGPSDLWMALPGAISRALLGALVISSLAITTRGTASPGKEYPRFLNSSEQTVLTSAGQTAYLYCGVEGLGDRAVSWIRSRDLTILTIGEVRYTRDPRFTAIHSQGNAFWALKIVRPRVEDSGQYECQLSYHDDMEKKLKLPFTLSVLESRARITGSRELFMKEGSRVELECGVEEVPGPPAYIYWYKQDQVLSYTAQAGGHQLTISTAATPNNTLISTLSIASATTADSGNYTCAPANARTDSVFLNVVKGEKPEGLREISNTAWHHRTSPLVLIILLVAPALC